MAFKDRRQIHKFGFAICRSRRIVWRIQYEPFRVFRYRFFQSFWPQLKTAVSLCRRNDGRSSGGFYKIGVGVPEWSGDQDFVSGIDGRPQGVRQDLYGASANGNLVRLIIQIVFAREFLGDRRFERGRAVNIRIFCFAILGRRLQPNPLYELALQNRVAQRQINDVMALLDEFARHAGDCRESPGGQNTAWLSPGNVVPLIDPIYKI